MRAFIHLYKGNVGPGCFSFAASRGAGVAPQLIVDGWRTHFLGHTSSIALVRRGIPALS